MPKNTDSVNTDTLELQSLQLDMQQLRREREDDRKEFADFTATVQSNFVAIQENFSAIQANFAKFLSTTVEAPVAPSPAKEFPSGHGSSAPLKVASQEKGLQCPHTAPAGHCTLHDHTGREINLDGTAKQPYRHPNFQNNQKPDQIQHHYLEDDMQDEEPYDVNRRGKNRALAQSGEVKRLTPVVKPAKFNVPEFDGNDADSWIQQVEIYFDAARTPIEQRTEFAVSYLQGKAIQWWRGTGYPAATLPWHRFCSYITERFAENSICDNVKAFHALTQTGSVNAYIEQFEKLVNLVRRDNPTLPNDYYINCFISGLSDYIQSHLQCHKPTTMQQATWLARRIEQSVPARRPVYQQLPFQGRKAIYLDPTTKPVTLTQPTSHASQQARTKNLCYKCKEPWFPGHKQVCKLANKVQVQAIQQLPEEEPDIIYVTEYDEEDEDEVNPPNPEAVLKISMHAVKGKDKEHYTFTVTTRLGDISATALVDSGSSASFITPTMAERAKCQLFPNKRIKVLVANGEPLYSEFQTENSYFTIQGH
uniref:Uncharacterized protein n=1 Tax=Avena sativa TaxID=4498 RepID=A0ACD5XBM2_AVESA